MQTQKMNLANIKGKLSRAEMKKIMAGSGGYSCSSPEVQCKCNGVDQGCFTPAACLARC